MNPEPFNDLSWNDDPLHSPNRTEYIERLRRENKALKEDNERMGNALLNASSPERPEALNTLRVRVKDLEMASDMWKAKADDHEDELVQIHEQRRTLAAKLTTLEKEVADLKENLRNTEG